jgi:threonine/homoserine/homoserine lactone efflux protein
MTHQTSYVSGILLVYLACLLGLMSPGPNILSVIGTSMGAGRRAGVWLALGVSAGTPIWGVATGLGLTALLAAYASALLVIKVVGGLYLLWLAFRAFRSAFSTVWKGPLGRSRVDPPLRCFLRGLMVQLMNPKAALTWIAIMSLGVQRDAPHWVIAIIVVGTTLLSVAGHLLYALAFSSQHVVAVYQHARRWIELSLGAFFGFAGIRLLTSRS